MTEAAVKFWQLFLSQIYQIFFCITNLIFYYLAHNSYRAIQLASIFPFLNINICIPCHFSLSLYVSNKSFFSNFLISPETQPVFLRTFNIITASLFFILTISGVLIKVILTVLLLKPHKMIAIN